MSPVAQSPRVRPAVLAGSVAGAALVVGSAWTYLGVPYWHYNVAFVAMAAFAAWRWKRYLADPPLLAAHLLVSGVVAIASGFLLLYLKDDLKASGTKDWAKFWHCAFSMWFLYVTIAHLARRPNARAVSVYARDGARRGWAWAHVAAWGATVLLLFASVASKDTFVDANYLYWSTLTVLFSTAIAYGAWIAAKLRSGAWRRDAPPRSPPSRALRGNVDLMLVGWSVLAQASGLVLLYGKEFLHGNGYKYVSKFWHTAPSVVMTLLVVAHFVISVPLLRAYWLGRRAARAARPVSPAEAAGK